MTRAARAEYMRAWRKRNPWHRRWQREYVRRWRSSPAQLVPVVTEYPCGPAKVPLQIHPAFSKKGLQNGKA